MYNNNRPVQRTGKLCAFYDVEVKFSKNMHFQLDYLKEQLRAMGQQYKNIFG